MDPAVVKPVVNPDTIYAGSSDTTRSPGFHSIGNDSGVAPVPGASLSAITSAAPTTPTLTPGMLAAQNASPNQKKPGVLGMLPGGALLGGVVGGLFRKNASPIQDIAGALALGRPISDKSWKSAGFGPGGAALVPAAPAPTPVNPRTSLSTINQPMGANYSAAFPQR